MGTECHCFARGVQLDAGKEVYIVTTINRLSPLFHYVCPWLWCFFVWRLLCSIVFMWAGLTCVWARVHYHHICDVTAAQSLRSYCKCLFLSSGLDQILFTGVLSISKTRVRLFCSSHNAFKWKVPFYI